MGRRFQPTWFLFVPEKTGNPDSVKTAEHAAGELDALRKGVESLKKENESLKKENESLKKENKTLMARLVPDDPDFDITPLVGDD